MGKNKRHVLFLLFFLFNNAIALAQQKGTFCGTVNDENGPLIGAHIIVKDTYWGTVTDYSGNFEIQLPVGHFMIQYRMIGYKMLEDTVQIAANQATVRHITLMIEPIKYRGIVVEADRNQKDPLYTSNIISVPLAKNAPPLGEPDIFNAVMMLPGVIQHNDLQGGMHFRGGGADQNLVLLDDVEIYNPYHLLGIFGTFNIQALETATVFIGDFPVKYGDRISSVIDIRTINSVRKTMINASLLSSSIFCTQKWQKMFFLFAARRTYLDFLFPALPYSFTDVNMKINGAISSNWHLELLGFYDKDHLAPEDKTNDSDFNWGNLMGAIRLSWHNRVLISSFQFSIENNFVDFSNDPIIDNKINDITFKNTNQCQWKNQELAFGIAIKSSGFNYEWYGKYNDLKEIFHEGTPEQFSYSSRRQLLSAFLSDKIVLSPTVLVEAGIRYNYWQKGNYWSPRISSLWRIMPFIEAKMSYGSYSQMLAYGREGIEGSVGSLLFPTLKPINGIIYSLGLNFNFPNHINIAIEGYKRSLQRLPQFSSDFPIFEMGKGNIKGIDILLGKSQGGLTFQFSYSYLKSRALFSDVQFPFDWDAAHTFNGLLGYEISKGWFFNCCIKARSGTPITPVVGKYYRVASIVEHALYRNYYEQYIEGNKNSERLPNYFRLDVSLRKKFYRQRFNYSIYLQVINVLNTKNTLRYEWEQYYSVSHDEPERSPYGAINSLPILPSFGVEFEF